MVINKTIHFNQYFYCYLIYERLLFNNYTYYLLTFSRDFTVNFLIKKYARNNVLMDYAMSTKKYCTWFHLIISLQCVVLEKKKINYNTYNFINEY